MFGLSSKKAGKKAHVYEPWRRAGTDQIDTLYGQAQSDLCSKATAYHSVRGLYIQNGVCRTAERTARTVLHVVLRQCEGKDAKSGITANGINAEIVRTRMLSSGMLWGRHSQRKQSKSAVYGAHRSYVLRSDGFTVNRAVILNVYCVRKAAVYYRFLN